MSFNMAASYGPIRDFEGMAASKLDSSCSVLRGSSIMTSFPLSRFPAFEATVSASVAPGGANRIAGMATSPKSARYYVQVALSGSTPRLLRSTQAMTAMQSKKRLNGSKDDGRLQAKKGARGDRRDDSVEAVVRGAILGIATDRAGNFQQLRLFVPSHTMRPFP